MAGASNLAHRVRFTVVLEAMHCFKKYGCLDLWRWIAEKAGFELKSSSGNCLLLHLLDESTCSRSRSRLKMFGYNCQYPSY